MLWSFFFVFMLSLLGDFPFLILFSLAILCFFLLKGPLVFSCYFLIDFYGWIFICLRVAIMSSVFIGSLIFFFFDFGRRFYFLLLRLLVFFLCLSFSVSGMLSFFLLFECSVIPIFLLILGWGFRMERLQARIYLFLYTLFFSLVFFFSLLYFFFTYFIWDFSFLFYLYSFSLSFFISSLFLLVFLVKLPVYFLHLWLPRAHVEASLAGSMILAGVLLKLGGYGLFRFYSLFWNFGFLIGFVMVVGILGRLFSGLICFRQVDMKCIVAYMSVSHMGLLLCSFFVLRFFGVLGFLLIMLAHGFRSSGLFCMLGCIYDRLLTRSSLVLRSGFSLFGVLSFWSFLLIVCNISCPPTLNFFSELFMSWGLFSYSLSSFLFIFCFLMLLTCYCSVHLFVMLFHGYYFSSMLSYFFSVRESFLFLVHLYPLFYLLFVF